MATTSTSDPAAAEPGTRPAVPTRTCIGCRRPLPKPALVRFAVVGREVHVDAAAVRPGRGCYVCDRQECLQAALAKEGRRLRQALRLSGIHATVDGEDLRTAWRRAVGTRTLDSSQ